MWLMETDLEDGQEAFSLNSEYVDVTCKVSSDTGGLILIAGEYRFADARHPHRDNWGNACVGVEPACGG